jgi:hypothetical protein
LQQNSSVVAVGTKDWWNGGNVPRGVYRRKTRAAAEETSIDNDTPRKHFYFQAYEGASALEGPFESIGALEKAVESSIMSDAKVSVFQKIGIVELRRFAKFSEH